MKKKNKNIEVDNNFLQTQPFITFEFALVDLKDITPDYILGKGLEILALFPNFFNFFNDKPKIELEESGLLLLTFFNKNKDIINEI